MGDPSPRAMDMVSGALSGQYGAGVTSKVGPPGTGLAFSGSQANGAVSWGPSFNPINGATAITIEVIISTTNINAASGVFLSKWATNQTILIQQQGSGLLGFLVGTGTGNTRTGCTVAGLIANDSPTHIFVTWIAGGTSGTWAAFVNRAAATATPFANSGVVSAVGNDSNNWQYGVANNGDPGSGVIWATRIWRRVLLTAEMASLSVNPWQIYTPLRRRWMAFAPPSAAQPTFRSRTIFGSRAGSRRVA